MINYAFEIIYYGKKNLPEYINYLNKIKFNIFNNLGLKFRKRLTIINEKKNSINFKTN